MPEYLEERFGGNRIRVYLSCIQLATYIFSTISVSLIPVPIKHNTADHDYCHFKSVLLLLLGIKCVSKHQDFQIFVLKLKNMSNFQPLKVVDRGSETQL